MRPAVTGVRTLRQETRLPGGRSHRAYQARLSDGATVVVKTDGDSRALRYEFGVLGALEDADHPAPRPLALTQVRDEDGTSKLGLVMSWIEGTTPTGAAGYRRLGTRLAQLHRLPARPGIPIRPALTVDELPRQVRTEVGPATAAAILGRPAPADADVVFSHGDAGPENFVDHPDGGALVDFESACRQPAAADLGRSLFLIADTRGADLAAAVAALRAGYVAGGSFPPQELSGWAAAEGLRVAAWRHRQAGRPGVPDWRAAIATVLRCRRQIAEAEQPC
jgi:aminoglycoside phosphotransferase (APT) family kinase protein